LGYFDPLDRAKAAPVQRVKFGTQFRNACAQQVGIGLVDAFGNQPGKQDLGVIQGRGQVGQPAGADRGPQF
jgi:hypothetical protein